MPTHGSLSKAGKTSSLTGLKKDRSKSGFNPRIKNKRKYNNRIILERNAHRKGTALCLLRLSRMIRDSELCLDEV